MLVVEGQRDTNKDRSQEEDQEVPVPLVGRDLALLAVEEPQHPGAVAVVAVPHDRRWRRRRNYEIFLHSPINDYRVR